MAPGYQSTKSTRAADVIGEDGISPIAPFGALFVPYQLLNLPGRDNPQNESLRAGRVTLSRSDLITIQ